MRSFVSITLLLFFLFSVVSSLDHGAESGRRPRLKKTGKKKTGKKTGGSKETGGKSKKQGSGKKGGGSGVVVEPPLPDPTPAPIRASEALRQDLEFDNVYKHLEELQAFSDQNGGDRQAGSLGEELTVDYLTTHLRNAGYIVSQQEIQLDSRAIVLPKSTLQIVPAARDGGRDDAIKTFAFDQDFIPIVFTSSGIVVATAQKVDNFGCESSDFANFTSGNIAIIKRGSCHLTHKINLADVVGGAVGVVIYGDSLQLGQAPEGLKSQIPAVIATTAVGLELIGSEVRLSSLTRQTGAIVSTNVIAETPFGDPQEVVMLGAHIDSVADAPGINDNGSGAAMLLELAIQLIKYDNIENKVRFGFWGAEELGLLGSQQYVQSIFQTEGIMGLQNIDIYLNFDMIGCFNYVRVPYPAWPGFDGSVNPAEVTIAATFVEYYNYTGLPTGQVQPGLSRRLEGGSDHASFRAFGIPGGGLFTGVGGFFKTEEEAALYGGTAGLSYEECYHEACDNLERFNTEIAEDAGQAAAHVLWTFANVPGGSHENVDISVRRMGVVEKGEKLQFPPFDKHSPFYYIRTVEEFANTTSSL